MRNTTDKELSTIICAMPEAVFEKLCNDDYLRWELDNRVAYNALRRMLRLLNKYNLTLADWDHWCDHD